MSVWHIVRSIGLAWCGVLFVMVAWQIVWFGEVHLDASAAHDLSARDVIMWLAGFGCAAATIIRDFALTDRGAA